MSAVQDTAPGTVPGTGTPQHDGGASSAGTVPELFKVVRGNPDDAELAALAAVLAAVAGSTSEGADEPGTEAAGSRRDALRSQARRRRQLSGHPGAWRSGRF